VYAQRGVGDCRTLPTNLAVAGLLLLLPAWSMQCLHAHLTELDGGTCILLLAGFSNTVVAGYSGASLSATFALYRVRTCFAHSCEVKQKRRNDWETKTVDG